MIYFRKGLLNNAVYWSDNGAQVAWEPLDGDFGVLAIDETVSQSRVDDLRGLARRRVGGVAEISGATYEELKKKFPWQPSRQPIAPRFRVVREEAQARNGNVQAAREQASAGVAAGSGPAQPVAGVDSLALPERTGFRPRTGRLLTT